MFLSVRSLRYFQVSLQKLVRLAVKATLCTTIATLGLVLNMMKRHPKTLELIHRKGQAGFLPPSHEGDPYDETAPDPMDSKAAESSLWELQYLKQ